jgi:hypothetical protein
MATTAAPNNAKTPNDTLKAKVQTLEKRVEMLTSTHIANVALQALAEEGFPIKNKCLNDIVSDAGFTYEDDVVEIVERELDKIDYISEGRAEELIDAALENTPDEDRVNELIGEALEDTPNEDRVNELISEALNDYEPDMLSRDDVVEIINETLPSTLTKREIEALFDRKLSDRDFADRNDLRDQKECMAALAVGLSRAENLLSRLSDSHQQLSDAVQPHVSRDVRSEISEAGYRIAAKQVTTMVHAPLAKAISAHTDSEMAKLIIASDFGKAAIGGLLSASTEYFAGSRGLSEGHATTARELAKEFRVGAAATAGNLITSILVDQIKEVLTGAFAPKVRVVNEESADVEEEFAAQHNNQRRAAHG